MKCEDIEKLISEFIDNEIEESLRKMMEEHLKECRRCLSLFETIEKTIALSRSIYRKKKVPKDVSERVYYEVRIRFKK